MAIHLSLLFSRMSWYEQTVDFICSFENTVNTRITVNSFNFVFLHETVSTMNLYSFIYNIIQYFRTNILYLMNIRLHIQRLKLLLLYHLLCFFSSMCSCALQINQLYGKSELSAAYIFDAIVASFSFVN